MGEIVVVLRRDGDLSHTVQPVGYYEQSLASDTSDEVHRPLGSFRHVLAAINL